MDDVYRGHYRSDDEVTLGYLWRALFSQKLLITSVVFVTTLAALAIALLSPTIYRATVLLAPVQASSAGGMANLAAQFGADLSPSGPTPTDEAVAVLKSRRFGEQFIEAHELMPVLVERDPEDDPPTMWDAFKALDQIRLVDQDPETGLIKLHVEWRDPATAAAWANAMVVQINDDARARTIEAAERNLQYLDEQLARTTIVNLRNMLYGLIEGERRTVMLANAQPEFAFRVLDPAVPPQDKIRPRRAFIVLAGLFAGLVLGSLGALVRHSVRHA